ncbi:MAG: aspartate--tRNA ligase [Zavarzinella sp.]
MADWQRTHTCGALRLTDVSSKVTLNGWVHTIRTYNDQTFIDLRDRYGLTQIVFDGDLKELAEQAKKLGREFCISVTGEVVARLPGKANPKLATGEIEVRVSSMTVLNESRTPPFEVTEFGNELANEDLRMQHRYLDLRRRSIQEVLQMRHRLCTTIRTELDKQQFLEIETPLLGKSTPEGARDYLVPSRLFHGEWYALPQSPQLYKQLLMIAGYDRYFQLARCLRDEDLRADRQPEFTQLDLEMSFVEQDDVLNVIEQLSVAIFRECLGIELPTPFPRMTYDEVMRTYGSDKPDLRYDMKIVDISEIAGGTTFKVFQDCLTAGGVVRGLCAKGAAGQFSNTDLKPGGKLTKFVADYGAKGLAFLKVEQDTVSGSLEKFLTPEQVAALKADMGAETGDLLLFVADQENVVCDSLGALRSHLAQVLKLYDPTAKIFNILWVIDFPSFMWDAEENRWVANHHPFTAPKDEDVHLMSTDPGKVRAKAYDLVLNGYEVGGGSIRIHQPEVQSKMFELLGMAADEAQARFGFLLDALKFGAPPHGGIALGVDRWAMMIAGTTNIRDVIAFPKNQKARDLMTGAPASVDARQLKDLGLK